MSEFKTTCDSCGTVISVLEPVCPHCDLKEKETATKVQKQQLREHRYVTDDIGQTIEVKLKEDGGKKYFVAVKQQNPDKSVPVAVTMIVLFGFIGASISGLSGLIAGGVFGFAVTALVYAAQDSFR